jgi:3-hydroxyisobutyrate dehydrogenase-like beta-hydroxyacid dehydrogenase
MEQVRWGLIGLGEVGSTFARHIAAHSHGAVHVTDPLLAADPMPERMRRRLADLPVKIAPDISSLVAASDLVLSLVTAAVATDVATAAAAAWPGGLFVDFNSTSPSEKQRLAPLFGDGGYVDGAILGAISGEGAAVSLVLAGPRAEEAQAALTDAGFNAQAVAREVGGASALKMCRSVFMKGIECLFIEALIAASHFDVTEPVLANIEATFSTYGIRPLARMLVTTHAPHCERRAAEMLVATSMLEEAGLPHLMSRASRDFLSRSGETGISAYFDGELPAQPEKVIAYLVDAFRERES